MKAIIVGGGIGGLTTALMLRARGIDCELFEQADTHPRARRRHQHAAACDPRTGRPRPAGPARRRRHPHRSSCIYLNRHGQEVWREPRGLDAGHDVPQFSIHRGRLQGVIHRAVSERLGAEAIHTGCRLGAFAQDEGGVTAHFFDRTGAHVKPRAATC